MEATVALNGATVVEIITQLVFNKENAAGVCPLGVAYIGQKKRKDEGQM